MIIAIPVFLLASRLWSAEPRLFSKTFWRVSLVWMALAAAIGAVPRDYWKNPPGTKIIALPRGAQVTAVWSFRGNYFYFGGKPADRQAFCSEVSGYIGYPWFWRRNMSRLIGRDFGPRIMPIETQCECGDNPGIASICVYDIGRHKDAIMVFDRTGDSSSSRGVITRHFRLQGGVWILVAEDADSFENFGDFIPYLFLRIFVLPSAIGAVLLFVMLVLRHWRRHQLAKRVPVTKSMLQMLPSIFLQYTATYAWAILITFGEVRVTFERWMVYPIGSMAILALMAYLAYRVALRSEMRRSLAEPCGSKIEV